MVWTAPRCKAGDETCSPVVAVGGGSASSEGMAAGSSGRATLTPETEVTVITVVSATVASVAANATSNTRSHR